MRRLAPVALALALLVVAAPALARERDFQTPSKRIRCAAFSSGGPGAFVRCDLSFLNDRAALLRARGRGRIVRVTDAVSSTDAPVLRYGHSLRFGPFRCTSRTSGLTCRSRAGHGFFVSRERRRTF
jgi:uncharacterized protein DUF6636